MSARSSTARASSSARPSSRPRRRLRRLQDDDLIPHTPLRVECKVESVDCVQCGEEDAGQSYCAQNNYKQQLRCLETKGNTTSYLQAETTSYYTFQPCPLVKGDFLSFVRFELLMIIVTALAFYYVQKRKKRQQMLQQWRIAGYV